MNTKMLVLDDLCRLCADQLLESGVNVFTPENSNVLSIILQCIPITISEDDIFPKNVCCNCLATLNSLHELCKKSLKAVDIFKNAIAAVLKSEDMAEKLASQDIKIEVLSDVDVNEEPEVKFEYSDVPSFECKTDLQTHVRLQSPGEEQEIFVSCNQNGDDLFQYGETDELSKPFGCQNYGFSTMAHVAGHQLTHSDEKPFKCLDCGRRFSLKSNLTSHQRVHSGEKPFQCQECGKSFTLKTGLIRHEKTHSSENRFRCQECGKSFACKPELIKHLRNHFGDKPHQCPQCGKTFLKESYLIRHLQAHSPQIFVCQECGKCYAKKSSLNRHSCKREAAKKLSECKECGKSFDQIIHLNIHKRSHSGDKPFQCRKCGKGFLRKNDCVRHAVTHLNEKQFRCQECGRSFSQKSDLVKHLRTYSVKCHYKGTFGTVASQIIK